MWGEGGLQSINSLKKSNCKCTYNIISQFSNFVPGKEFDKLLYLSVIGETETTVKL